METFGPSTGAKELSWVGSLSCACIFVAAPAIVVLITNFGTTTVLASGVLCVTTGFVAASFATTYWHLYITVVRFLFVLVFLRGGSSFFSAIHRNWLWFRLPSLLLSFSLSHKHIILLGSFLPVVVKAVIARLRLRLAIALFISASSPTVPFSLVPLPCPPKDQTNKKKRHTNANSLSLSFPSITFLRALGLLIWLRRLPTILHLHQRPSTILQQTPWSRRGRCNLRVRDWIECDGSVTASDVV